MMVTFGEYFKKKRMELGKTLRQFCIENDLDPGNISKIERRRMAAPKSEEKLKDLAKCLKIKIGSNEWQEFKDLADISAHRIPEDLTDEVLLPRLPVFFRTLQDKKFTEEELNELIEKIRQS